MSLPASHILQPTAPNSISAIITERPAIPPPRLMSKSNNISVDQNKLFGDQLLIKIFVNTVEQNLQWLACRTEYTRVAWSHPTR